MMNWEPTLASDENNLTFRGNKNKDNSLPETPTNGSKFEDADANSFELMGQFEEFDVLLNGGRFSNHFKKDF